MLSVAIVPVVRAAVFDIQKLVTSILAFVNFFAARIAVTSFLFALIYSMSGNYYFDMTARYATNGPLAEIDLTSYIERAARYVTEGNVKNTIFVVALIVGLSLLDIVYRIVRQSRSRKSAQDDKWSFCLTAGTL